MPVKGETLTIELDPVIVGKDGGKYDQITVRSPKIGELHKARAQTSDSKVDAKLVELVAGVPDFVIAEMDAADFYKALKFIVSFINAGAEITSD